MFVLLYISWKWHLSSLIQTELSTVQSKQIACWLSWDIRMDKKIPEFIKLHATIICPLPPTCEQESLSQGMVWVKVTMMIIAFSRHQRGGSVRLV